MASLTSRLYQSLRVAAPHVRAFMPLRYCFSLQHFYSSVKGHWQRTTSTITSSTEASSWTSSRLHQHEHQSSHPRFLLRPLRLPDSTLLALQHSTSSSYDVIVIFVLVISSCGSHSLRVDSPRFGYFTEQKNLLVITLYFRL